MLDWFKVVVPILAFCLILLAAAAPLMVDGCNPTDITVSPR